MNNILNKICNDKRKFVELQRKKTPEKELQILIDNIERPRGFKRVIDDINELIEKYKTEIINTKLLEHLNINIELLNNIEKDNFITRLEKSFNQDKLQLYDSNNKRSILRFY